MTWNVLAIPRRRPRFWDVALGAVVMPVLALILFLCTLFEGLWKRLLIALDYNPPEEMRAGPKPPGEDETKKSDQA
jgi:hypothetical protein